MSKVEFSELQQRLGKLKKSGQSSVKEPETVAVQEKPVEVLPKSSDSLVLELSEDLHCTYLEDESIFYQIKEINKLTVRHGKQKVFEAIEALKQHSPKIATEQKQVLESIDQYRSDIDALIVKLALCAADLQAAFLEKTEHGVKVAIAVCMRKYPKQLLSLAKLTLSVENVTQLSQWFKNKALNVIPQVGDEIAFFSEGVSYARGTICRAVFVELPTESDPHNEMLHWAIDLEDKGERLIPYHYVLAFDGIKWVVNRDFTRCSSDLDF